jgi:hypothetical protein
LAIKNQIAATLNEHFDCSQPVYLLIDPMVGDFLPQLAFSDGDDAESICLGRERAFQRTIFPVILDASISLPPSRHPYLVEMTSPSDPWMDVSLELGQEQIRNTWASGMAGDGWGVAKVGGWLQSAMPGNALAGMLARWMQLSTEARSTARYLRLADSRVLALLAFVLGREKLVAAMGSLRRWSFLNAYGQLDSLDSPIPPEIANAPQSFRLDKEQWQIMQDGAAVHGAIAKAWGEMQKDSAETSHHSEIPYAAAVAAAKTFPVRPHPSEKSRVLCATLEDRCTAIALTLLHPGWESQLEVQRHLAENAEDSLSDSGHELYEILKCAAASTRSINANSREQP